jgi:ADP-heptose:LPS heptosyltransferase
MNADLADRPAAGGEAPAAAPCSPALGGVGPLEGVERIAVLRPNAIGDFVFALPALCALRGAYPRARIVLLGQRWHREFLQDRPGPVDEVLEMPAVRGVGAPADAPQDEGEVQRFVAALHARRFDLALQLYGGGRYSNPFVRRLGARLSVGLRADDAEPLDRWIRYERWRNERLRLLDVAALAGARPTELSPRLALLPRDEEALAAVGRWPASAALVVLQPGARDERRRWPLERFAAVGDALAEAGATVLVNGSAEERGLTAAVCRAMRRPAVDLAGRLPVSGLCALLARARLALSNDTGPLHLAQALGTPSVGIYWLPNLLGAEPLVAGPRRHAVAARLACPVCGVENLERRCAHQASFVEEVGVEEVRAHALALFSAGR